MERQRQSIPVQGINRAESDDTVKDGACEDIYNLRYRAEVFENVCQSLLLHPITQSGDFSVVHRLDVMEPGEYLAEKGGALYRVKIAEGAVTEREKITNLPGDATDVRYFHFGNVLYVNYSQGGELQELCFRYKDNAFARVDFGTLEPPTIEIAAEYKSVPEETFGDSSSPKTGVKLAYFYRNENDPSKNKDEFFYNIGIGVLNEEGYVTGTAYLFAAYKLFDGSIIKMSALRLISGDMNQTGFLYRSPIDDGYGYYGPVRGVKPTITVTVPTEAFDNSMIDKVVIFSTRNDPTWEYDRVHANFGKEPGFPEYPEGYNIYSCSRNCIWNEALDEPQGSFYEIATLDFKNKENSVVLTWEDHYRQIVNETGYTPNYSNHTTQSGGKYDYNDRLHIFDLRTRLAHPRSAFAGVASGDRVEDRSVQCVADYTLTAGGETVVLRTTTAGHYYKTSQSGGDGPPTFVRKWYIDSVQSYPDSRAEKIDIWVQQHGHVIAHKQIRLTSAPAANLAHALLRVEYRGDAAPASYWTRGNIVSSIELREGEGVDYSPAPDAEPNALLVERNKIQVSYPSNPFVYAPANIYTIGGQGEQIREIISTAERMTEAAYGYQPLLAFTNRTTYALESGDGEVLYARNIPILSQSMIEGTNAVEGNGAVFFVSTSGVTAIVRGQISTISEPMKRWTGLMASDATIPDFEKYTHAARLMFNRKESELIVFNSAFTYAYVYSLLGKYWTRRAWDAAIEPCFGEIVTSDGIASLFEEDPERPADSYKLVTRPLKLGSMEYKRLETLAARMRWGQGGNFVLSIEGSDDAIRWVLLRSESNMPNIRRTPSSFRYHRVQLTGRVGDYLGITHFDAEFYNKFVHRLR